MGLNQELLKVYGSGQLLWPLRFSSPCALCSSTHRKIHEQTVGSGDLLLSGFINLFSFNFPISNLLLQCCSWRRVSLMPNPDLSHAWARSMLDSLSTYTGRVFFPCKISSLPWRHVRLPAQLLPAGRSLLGFLRLGPADRGGEMYVLPAQPHRPAYWRTVPQGSVWPAGAHHTDLNTPCCQIKQG